MSGDDRDMRRVVIRRVIVTEETSHRWQYGGDDDAEILRFEQEEEADNARYPDITTITSITTTVEFPDDDPPVTRPPRRLDVKGGRVVEVDRLHAVADGHVADDPEPA